jgi:hypothetical protein
MGYLNTATQNPNAVTNPAGLNTPKVNTDISKPSITSNQATVQAQSYVQDLNPKAMAANQLKEFTAKDAPLMQRARAQGIQDSARRGFTGGSSIAAGAAMGAMVDRATPIVLQDAQSEANRQSENLAAQNATARFNAEQENARIRQMDSMVQDIERLEKEGTVKSNLQAQALREDILRLQKEGTVKSNLQAQALREDIERLEKEGTVKSNLQAQALREDVLRLQTQAEQDVQTKTHEANLQKDRDFRLQTFDENLQERKALLDRIANQEMSQQRREETILSEQLLSTRSQQDYVRDIAKMDAEVGREAALAKIKVDADLAVQQVADANRDLINRNQYAAGIQETHMRNIAAIVGDANITPAQQAQAIAKLNEAHTGAMQFIDAIGGAGAVRATAPTTPTINTPASQQRTQARSEINRLYQSINTATGENEEGVAFQISEIGRMTGMSPAEIDAAAGAPPGTTERYRAQQGWAG